MNIIYGFFLYCLLVVYPLNLAAQAQEFAGTAQPADVLVVIETIAAELETLREIMGKQEAPQNRFQVEFAEPRHVYYQV